MDPGNTIQIHFAALDLETHSDCGYDRLGKLSIVKGVPYKRRIFLIMTTYINKLILEFTKN